MIVNSKEMRCLETASGLPVNVLMKRAGDTCAEAIRREETGKKILILCGKGNNGGDGFVIAENLRHDHEVKILLACGMPTTPEAQEAFSILPEDILIDDDHFIKYLSDADVIIDAVFGFSYHGTLREKQRELFRTVNNSQKRVISIDLNSGCEADTGFCDHDAIRSDLTLALDCPKPFHTMRKNHHMFKRMEVLPLDLPHTITPVFTEMNEDTFFKFLPRKGEDAYKGTFGKITLIGGSYGMVGALCLNVLGAKTVGSSYIQAALPEEVYPIAASRSITTVYHPFVDCNWESVIRPLIHNSAAVGFGSGAVNMPHKSDCLDLLLQEASCPVVLDAEALRLLQMNTHILQYAKAPLVLTPHIGEFAALCGVRTAEAEEKYAELAEEFVRTHHVILVLKKPNTIVFSPDGRRYVNQSGNEALAQAGSGDMLTGILTGLLAMVDDPFTAVVMGVWLHGFLAEYGTRDHSRALFSLERFPELMDSLMFTHGY